jgi:hypothetical protein
MPTADLVALKAFCGGRGIVQIPEPARGAACPAKGYVAPSQMPGPRPEIAAAVLVSAPFLVRREGAVGSRWTPVQDAGRLANVGALFITIRKRSHLPLGSIPAMSTSMDAL